MTDNQEFVCYCVGQKYDKVMPGDGAIFELAGDKGYINIGFTDMTAEETATIESGNLISV